MQQNSTNWHQWRHKGIGSSDAPIIMRVSPYKSPFQLWNEKIKKEPPPEDNKKEFIFAKGHRLEKIARADFELQMGMEFPATTAERKDCDYIKASLDGWNQKQKEVAEIKYVGEKYYNECNNVADIKIDHFVQIQHQFIVTDAKCIHYIIYNDKIDSTKIIKVYPDVEFCKDLLIQEVAFWELVQKKKAPEFSDLDFKKSKSKSLYQLCVDYEEANNKAKLFQSQAKDCYKEIQSTIKHNRIMCFDFKITEFETRGSIKYSTIPEIKNLPKDYLEGFRGKSSKKLKITLQAKG